jgi:hypothetical protein
LGFVVTNDNILIKVPKKENIKWGINFPKVYCILEAFYSLEKMKTILNISFHFLVFERKREKTWNARLSALISF